MGKILLFYKYVDIDMPGAIIKWQRNLCESLNLKGRILIATEGINGTLGGTPEAIEAYKQAMNEHPLFGGIDFKDSEGDQDHFPRLRIVEKKEIVNLGIPPDQLKASEGGTHLTPQQVHDLISQKPEDLVIIDTRNNYESRVGTFTGAVCPDTQYFREFPQYVEDNKELFENKQVLMVCTGGVRCERASGYVKKAVNAKNVYQLQGGIHRYIEQFPDGHFRGSNYVFDARVIQKVNDDILSCCDVCKNVPTDYYNNCKNARCNNQYLVCPACLEQLDEACSKACFDLIQAGKVNIRTKSIRTTTQHNKSV